MVDNKHMNNKIIVIIGTTASGKTKLGIELANDINGEIINLDAFQIYKEIKIGTARPDSNELSMAKFHMDGVISIYDE
jgi:tRNA dimethylallyltransferase